MNENTRIKHSAKCPTCKEPHHYTEIRFSIANDRGSWLIECNECHEHFVVDLSNPEESDAGQCNVLKRFDNELEPYEGNVPRAQEIAAHNLNMNGQNLRFDFTRHPIYRCQMNGMDLEQSSLRALEAGYESIHQQLGQAVNRFLATHMPDVEHAVVTIPVECACGHDHQALFYAPFKLDGSSLPAPHDMLLAEISGTDLTDMLTGIFTKTYLMEALEKLIARWRLFSDQILIAAPFVAHQYKSKSERLQIWERLLSQLDARRTVFLTRSASYSEYKAALLDSGLEHGLLEGYGLENQIVSAGTKKQDFHAKVYAGIGDRCEVLSGSANLVAGKSMENAAFGVSQRQRFDTKYLDPLSVTLPPSPPRARHHVSIAPTLEGWRWTVADGAAPSLPQFARSAL